MKNDLVIWQVFTAEGCETGWQIVSTKWTSEEGPTDDRRVVAHLNPDCSTEDAERTAASMQKVYDDIRAIPLS